jgi:Rrf2 family protein
MTSHFFSKKYSVTDVGHKIRTSMSLILSGNLKIRLMFSKACEYAIRAAIFIASESERGHRASLKDIAREIDSPEAFTAKTLQKLTRSGIINSTKGAHGGFEVKPEMMSAVKVSQIVQAIDGDKVYTRCSLGLHNCSEDHPCPFHSRFKPVRNGLQEIVENTSLRDLTDGLVEGDTFLKSKY